MISINTRDPRPIYLQIKESVIRLILSGAMQKDERLPSVREMAGALAINPNTIQRAYRELENEGFIYSVTGRGSYVAALSEIDQGRRATKVAEFKAAARELLNLGTPRAELEALLAALEQEAKHD